MSKDQRYPIAGMAQDAILGRRLVCVRDCSADVRYSASTLGVQYTPGPMICCPIMATVAGRVSVIGLLQVGARVAGMLMLVQGFSPAHPLVKGSSKP
jgi:hypothetical protein